jgi:hypothetical protein
MKIRPVGAECSMRTDQQTDVTMLILAFRNFAYAPKNPTFFERSVICLYRMSR